MFFFRLRVLTDAAIVSSYSQICTVMKHCVDIEINKLLQKTEWKKTRSTSSYRRFNLGGPFVNKTYTTNFFESTDDLINIMWNHAATTEGGKVSTSRRPNTGRILGTRSQRSSREPENNII